MPLSEIRSLLGDTDSRDILAAAVVGLAFGTSSFDAIGQKKREGASFARRDDCSVCGRI